MEEEIDNEKLKKLHKYHIIADIILVIVILGISIYVIYNIESFKLLGQNVCKLCEIKTGATCYKFTP